MTVSPQAPWVEPRPSRWSAGRIVALVLGLLLLLPGLALLAGGGALLWADNSHRSTDGYLMSDQQRFSTPGFALTSDRVDLSTGASWLPVSSALGTARLEVTGDNGTDVFIGIARATDAAGYLNGVRRTVVDDVGGNVGSAGQRLVNGGAPAGPPGDQNFWVAQASGNGQQQLTWQPAAGNWVLVVMNSDASAGVTVTAGIGATVPSLGGLAWGLLIGGIVVTVVAVLLVVLGLRRRHRSPEFPAGGPPVAGWAAPEPRSATDDAATWTKAAHPDGGLPDTR